MPSKRFDPKPSGPVPGRMWINLFLGESNHEPSCSWCTPDESLIGRSLLVILDAIMIHSTRQPVKATATRTMKTTARSGVSLNISSCFPPSSPCCSAPPSKFDAGESSNSPHQFPQLYRFFFVNVVVSSDVSSSLLGETVKKKEEKGKKNLLYFFP